MKSELIKVIKFKLDHINENIDDLNEVNAKIDDENAKLQYIQNAIDNFKGEEHGFDIYKFSNVDRETFNKLLMELSDDVLVKFGTDSCNYEGLIYLINGINNGISLTLTQEQISAINLFIDKLLEKEKEHQDVINGLNDDKQKLDIKDLELLKEMENKYSIIIENIEDEKYITEIDDIVSAIEYNNLSFEKTFDILCYLLKYNSEIYELNKEVVVKEKNDVTIDLTKDFEASLENENNEVEVNVIDLTNEQPQEIEVQDEEEREEVVVENEIEQPAEFKLDLSFDQTMELPEFDYLDKMNQNLVIENADLELPVVPIMEEDEQLVNEEEFVQLNEDVQGEYNPVLPFVEETDEIEKTQTLEPINELELEEKENVVEITEEVLIDEEILQEVFQKYNIKYEEFNEEVRNLLQKGEVENYRNVLSKLESTGMLEKIKNNLNIISELVLYSSVQLIDEVNSIIENDLSVDKRDKYVTKEIIYETMPTIFVEKENGGYNNFIKNVQFFKSLGINLINLFDFSREVFVADNELINNNYKIVREYNFEINVNNAKYLLLLPNVSEKIDYYVESVYKDQLKNETFDGIDLIKLYPNKLNVVCDETIKRLRYASETGRKVLGSKEKSLSSEITYLKVDVINMSDEYLRSLFNNEFDTISKDEVDSFEKMVSNNKYVDLVLDDKLNKLEKYRNGIRYVLEGINVSRNKVLRNYNILISNGVSHEKALLFAVCYNLIVTKEEYGKIKTLVNGLGGN